MAWTNLTFFFEEVLASNKMTQLYDNFAAMATGTDANAPKIYNAAAIVTRTANQSIPNATYTPISFDSQHFVNWSMHQIGTNPTRITIKVPGRHIIIGRAIFATNGTGVRAMRVVLNGTTFIGHAQDVDASVDSAGKLMMVCDRNFSVDDYIELEVYQSSGGSLNLIQVNDQYPFFSAERV